MWYRPLWVKGTCVSRREAIQGANGKLDWSFLIWIGATLQLNHAEAWILLWWENNSRLRFLYSLGWVRMKRREFSIPHFLVCRAFGPFCLFLIFYLVSTPAIRPYSVPTSQQWQASSCFWNAMLLHASGPLHMLSWLLAIPFPLPFLASLPDRWSILRSETLPSPLSGVSYPSLHILKRLCQAPPPTPRQDTCAHHACSRSLLHPRSSNARAVLQLHKVMHYPYCSLSTRQQITCKHVSNHLLSRKWGSQVSGSFSDLLKPYSWKKVEPSWNIYACLIPNSHCSVLPLGLTHLWVSRVWDTATRRVGPNKYLMNEWKDKWMHEWVNKPRNRWRQKVFYADCVPERARL